MNTPTADYSYVQIDFATVSAGLVAGNTGMFWQDDDSTVGGGDNSFTSFGSVIPQVGVPFAVLIDLTEGGTNTSGATGWGPGTLEEFRLDLFENSANAGESFTISAITFGSSVISAPPATTFSDWIADPDDGYFPGETDPEIVGLDADPDGDGIDNGVENYFGTPPNAPSTGLVAGIRSGDGSTFTLTHPLNADPASDLTATYRWSTDLVTFYDDGSSNDTGTTVAFSDPTPSGGVSSVTASITGTIPDKLFVDVKVTQPYWTG